MVLGNFFVISIFDRQEVSLNGTYGLCNHNSVYEDLNRYFFLKEKSFCASTFEILRLCLRWRDVKKTKWRITVWEVSLTLDCLCPTVSFAPKETNRRVNGGERALFGGKKSLVLCWFFTIIVISKLECKIVVQKWTSPQSLPFFFFNEEFSPPF